MTSYVRDMTVMHRRAALDDATEADLLGTDSTAFRTSTLHFDVREWEHVNLVDLSFALAARRESVPLVAIPRAKGWVNPLAERQDDSIWLGVRRDDTKQTALAQELVGAAASASGSARDCRCGHLARANVDSPAMPACPSCGFENADTREVLLRVRDGARRAPRPLVARSARSSPSCSPTSSARRRAPSGSTPRTSARSSRPYHARLRHELERHGGTVEKFIGDAVVAVFGAPVAHEDDPERAVRAALAIQEAIAEMNEADPALDLEVRIGVNTGEALVALDARPELGEGDRLRRRR